MRTLQIIILYLVCLCGIARGSEFHWVDAAGFHSVEKVEDVPLEHRRDLPMARLKEAFPFTEEEDREGSMYVWFMLREGGVPVPYVAAADVPKARHLVKVKGKPQTGDIALGSKGYMALSDGKGSLMSAAGRAPLQKIGKKLGKVTWYRVDLPEQPTPAPVAPVPADLLAQADNILSRLKPAATFPPQVESDAAHEALVKEWEMGEAEMETLRRKHPDAPQLLAKVGEFYRRGHNLDVPVAWEKAEAFLLQAETLDPALLQAYVSLGSLYAFTGFEHAAKGERQYRTALTLAKGDDQAPALWGLAMALYFQGRVGEAVKTVERLEKLQPGNEDAKRLRETLMSVTENGKRGNGSGTPAGKGKQ